MNRTRLAFICLLIFSGALLRLAPHPWNFTPIGAIALFGGAAFRRSSAAFLIPLAALLISDLVAMLGGTNSFHQLTPPIYLCFLLVAVLGRLLQARRSSAVAVAAGALVSSLLFFIVTNFFVWLFLGTYELTFQGLALCYVRAIPLYWNQLAGDLFYTAILFGGLAWAEHRIPALRTRPAV